MKYKIILIAVPLLLLALSQTAQSEGIVFYSFEGDAEEWHVPDWTRQKEDLVNCELNISGSQATEGKYSLELSANFPGNVWRAAYIEREIAVNDWTPFGNISVDMYLPEYAPYGLKARLILTVGEEWKWVELNRGQDLIPGEWTIVTADLGPASQDWKYFLTEDLHQNVKRLGIRIESDKAPAYKGSVYIDNIRLY